MYFRSGTADLGLPGEVEGGAALRFAAHMYSTQGPLPTGSAGVVTFYIPGRHVTVALMWAVPFNYGLYSNMWNVDVLKGNQPASSTVYYRLYYSGSPHKGDGNFVEGRLVDGDWTYEGSMGHSAKPFLDVSIFST